MSDEENLENGTVGRRCTSVDLKLCISPHWERLGNRYLASLLCQSHWSPCLLDTKTECPYLKHQIGISQKPCDLHRQSFILASKGILSSYPDAMNLLCALEKMIYLSLLSCNVILGPIFDWRLFRRRTLAMIQRLAVWSLQAGVTSFSLAFEEKKKTLLESLLSTLN